MAKRKASGIASSVFLVAVFLIFVVIFALAAFLPDDSDSYVATPDRGMYFEYMNVDIDWNDDRSCKIEEEIEVKFLESSHGIYVDIPVNSGEKVRNISVETVPDRPYSLTRESGNKIIRAVVGDPDIEFRSGSTMVCKISYEMITPEHSQGSDILAFNAIGGGWTCRIKKANVRMTYPAAPENAGSEYGIWVGTNKVSNDTDGVSVNWSNDNKTVEIDISNRFEAATSFMKTESFALDWFEKVELAYKMPNGTLRDYSDTEFLVTLGIGLALLVLFVVLKLLIKNKELTPIVDFYPPRIDGKDGEKRHMLPVQMGKLIDGGCSNEDVTSLIFYWASKGYIAIEDRDDGTYFKKLKEVEAVTNYEKKLFDKMFSFADSDEEGNKTVALSSLKGKFAGSINTVKQDVNREYKGKLYRKGFIGLTAGMFALCALYGIGITLLTSLRVGSLVYGFGAVMALVFQGLSIGAGVMLVSYYHKLGGTKRKALTVLYFIVNAALAFIAAMSVPIDVMGWLERAIFAACLCVPMTLAPFFVIRTDYYNEQLNQILGFGNFLRDAEKAQLETLLEDDPQYYYDILPYANVLGVSDIWADKFKDITVQPPTYYNGSGMTVFNLYVMSKLMSSVGNTLATVPKSSGGSFSSHGGGRSGGGFSGGSFGGGGGGRW